MYTLHNKASRMCLYEPIYDWGTKLVSPRTSISTTGPFHTASKKGLSPNLIMVLCSFTITGSQFRVVHARAAETRRLKDSRALIK